MVLNAIFNNISLLFCPSVLLVEETWVLGENHRPAASHWQTLLHNVISSTPRHYGDFVVILFIENATRFCTTNGTWAEKSDYNSCLTDTTNTDMYEGGVSCYSSIFNWHIILDPKRILVTVPLTKGALDSQLHVIKITGCLTRVGGSLRVLRLPPPLKLVAILN
jgi:hypothetical protein